MGQLLLEIFSEEIPARMQTQAGRDLARLIGERLKAAGLTWDSLETFAGPRRLTLVAEGVPAATPDRSEELKGPRTSAPAQALEGFLRKTGLTQDQLVERDGVWFAVVEQAGRPTPEVVAEAVDQVIRAFPWPKSMRWADATLRWVRPIRRVLCLFDGQVVPFAIADGSSGPGVVSGDVTEGHRVMGSGQPLKVRDFADYRQQLLTNGVLLDAAERKARILERARAVCAAEGLELVEDEGLLEEVAGLAEWPTPVLGRMDPAFLDLPPEVIRTSMRAHQKYFAVRRPGEAGLAPYFVVVANLEAADGGAALAAGNARVLSARLNDARFFWDEDRKAGNFDAWLEKLKGVTFHAKLGTMAERVERIAALAREIAPRVGADPDQAERAARLAKADLASGMVGEFPELQGIMGGYYARAAGEPDAIADAIRDHYRPQGPGDAAPTAPLTVAVALADKLDTLVGFFGIDERPTGSKDPYALRRAALGVIRIVLENGVKVNLRQLAVEHAERGFGWDYMTFADVADRLMMFLTDRLAVSLRDRGARHDHVEAALATLNTTEVFLDQAVGRVNALTAFLATEDGANLLAGYKRATNILKAEAKKGELPEGEAVALDGAPAEETALIAALATARVPVEGALAAEDFAGAMAALAGLRGPVDAFFEAVLVNSDVAAERDNRLKLLGQVRDLMGRVADFSLVAG